MTVEVKEIQNIFLLGCDVEKVAEILSQCTTNHPNIVLILRTSLIWIVMKESAYKTGHKQALTLKFCNLPVCVTVILHYNR